MKRRSIVLTLALLTAAAVGLCARQQFAIESRDQPATADDLRILRRADALLGDASVWNRHDDRVCDDDEAGGKRQRGLRSPSNDPSRGSSGSCGLALTLA
jgi:hypothetical protein